MEIYSQRNSQIWRKKKYQLFLKAVVGGILNYLEEKPDLLEEFNQSLVVPHNESEKTLKRFVLPFEPIRHKHLLAKNFEDQEDQLDLNNIPDNLPRPNNMEGLNQLNPNQNWLQLLLNSLVPWNVVPNQEPREE